VRYARVGPTLRQEQRLRARSWSSCGRGPRGQRLAGGDPKVGEPRGGEREGGGRTNGEETGRLGEATMDRGKTPLPGPTAQRLHVTRGGAAGGDGAEPRRRRVDLAMDPADPPSIGP
jgi:hypothetical protein